MDCELLAFLSSWYIFPLRLSGYKLTGMVVTAVVVTLDVLKVPILNRDPNGYVPSTPPSCP